MCTGMHLLHMEKWLMAHYSTLHNLETHFRYVRLNVLSPPFLSAPVIATVFAAPFFKRRGYLLPQETAWHSHLRAWSLC
jgi:hypothetical protein